MDREEAISEWTFRRNHIKRWLKEYGEEPSIRHYVELIDMAIEALSAEQEEEELAKDIARRMATIIENEQDMRVILKNASADRPSGEWIPVSERLPQNTDWVLVTIEDDSGDNTLKYTTVGWMCYQYWIVDNENVNGKVIAWMPLPEPYKRGEEE